MNILPPSPNDNFGNFSNYINKVVAQDLLTSLQENQQVIEQKILALSEEQLNHKYQVGKWSIKEVIGHLIDTERVFAYRAMRFARKDKTPLPGYDEVLYGDTSNAGQRDIQKLVAEFSTVRQGTILLFESFTEEMLEERGIASNLEVSVRALGFAILGHCIHHLQIIDERYLNSSGE
jgi:uncharacterized damage-inducible protein DinB